MTAIQAFLDRNRAFSTSFSEGGLPADPAARIAVVTCMDARLNPAAFLGIDLGAAHVIRNAGGIVTDDVIRSLMMSQRLLGTTSVMVIQHTKCGLLSLDEAALRDQVRESAAVEIPFELGGFQHTEESVRQGVALLKESPLLTQRDDIHGFVYDVDTGRVREVG